MPESNNGWILNADQIANAVNQSASNAQSALSGINGNEFLYTSNYLDVSANFLRREATDWKRKIADDKQLLDYYSSENDIIGDTALSARDAVLNAVYDLSNIADMMMAEVDSFCLAGIPNVSGIAVSALQEYTTEYIFNQLFNPILNAFELIQPLASNMFNLPNLPIVGNLSQIITNIINVTGVLARLPKGVLESARKKAEENPESFPEYARHIIGDIVDKIVTAFKEVIEIIKTFVQNIQLGLLVMALNIINSLIPVAQDIMQLAQSAYDLIKNLMMSQAKLFEYFYKMLEQKLKDMWNVICYANTALFNSPESEDMINFIKQDIEYCNGQLQQIDNRFREIDQVREQVANSEAVQNANEFIKSVDSAKRGTNILNSRVLKAELQYAKDDAIRKLSLNVDNQVSQRY